ncbi:MAG: PaaI family thioesterase [Sphingobium sp.]
MSLPDSGSDPGRIRSADGGDGNGQGWRLFDFRGSGTWPDHWPAAEYRRETDRLVRFRQMPPETAVNHFGTLHGAFLAGVAENALGLFLAKEGQGPVPAVTVSLSLDYAAPGKAGMLLEGELELIRDSYHMQFLRLTLSQDGAPVLHGSGILKKLKSA